MARDLLDYHDQALEEFGRRVHQVGDAQWHDPTPCTEWDVRDLVGHLVVEQLWVPPILAGERTEDVGDRFGGDLLGDDPATAWDRARSVSRTEFRGTGALERTVHLSYGESSARRYCWEMTFDLAVHAWDLARAIGANERLDLDLVSRILEWTEPRAEELAGSGIFASPVPTAPDADLQTRLLGLVGRRA